jgi:hypothetical protein
LTIAKIALRAHFLMPLIRQFAPNALLENILNQQNKQHAKCAQKEHIRVALVLPHARRVEKEPTIQELA